MYWSKYTSRWKFYRTAAMLCNAPNYDLVREVVNPSKDHKLKEVASRYQINPVEFGRVARQLRRTVASVSGASTSELVLGETKSNNTKPYLTECLGETAPGNRLSLDDAGNYYDANSGM
ncbi:hypothetical protein M7I_8286 [Glarea lozoyensis 74030]|uniref:Uncharacterized protein n=1 Tax=Glarea lozoyensis (strain ATCC 74030 / MF5533) TaxID=1104152 RepID=H0EZL2_GLAL7|nr:hypothetical protein M7I_8286 [Glarea lozoyensis 74030]